jgi:hypothetical protein
LKETRTDINVPGRYNHNGVQVDQFRYASNVSVLIIYGKAVNEVPIEHCHNWIKR